MTTSTRSSVAPRSPRSISAPSLAIGVAFGNGVLSFCVPCAIALLPAYLGLVTDSTRGAHERSRAARLLLGSLVFAAGFSAVFVVLGYLAGAGIVLRTTGADFDRWAAAVVIVVAGALVVEARQGRLRAHRLGPLALGSMFGAAFAASVGPFLARVLVLAANTASGLWGAVLLLVYALGVFLPFAVCTLAIAESGSAVRRLSARTAPLCLIGAVLLAALAVVLLVGRYGVVTDWLDRILPFASQ